MNEVTLPPAPNWYLSNILACSYDGTVAWGARNMIVIAKPGENEKILQYSIIKHAHKSKVTCIAFPPYFKEVVSRDSYLMASTGDDNTIKIWDLQQLCTMYTHRFEADIEPICISWSHKDPYVLHGGISDGSVLSWNAYFDTTSSILLRGVPTCISTCPHDSKLVAVGSKTGLVYILNLQGKGKIIYKLRGHDNDIVSLSWCPSENNVLSGSLNKDLLLASGGRDRSIFIWKAGGDGRYEITISLPALPFDSQKHKSKLNASVGSWIVVDWIEPKLLLASSYWGELISYDLSTMKKSKPNAKLIHGYHNRGLFCIAHVPTTQETIIEDWRVKQRHTIWTLGQDRRIICCGIKENNIEIDHDIFTQGGYVYCIAACPLDTSHVAFGVGDAMLRLWNLSAAHSTTFDITIVWQKIKGKIRTVSWHPEKENLVAFATEEGRVGVLNTSGGKPPTLYRQYHRSTVYVIGWGPNPRTKQHALYSCAEGELVYYDREKPNEEPASVLKTECTEFSWKPDFSYLAVGFKNGKISFLNPEFEICGYAKYSTEMVHCLVWHPESTATDSTISPFRNYLAVAFESCTIEVYDLTNFIERVKNDNLDENDIHRVRGMVATLNGHSRNVVCLAWNPYISGQLVSGGYDGVVQVWNVETGNSIATCYKHSGPVLCCMWSPLDPDFIITGSADFTLRIWNVTSHLVEKKEYQIPEEETGKKQKKAKKKLSVTNKVINSSTQNNVTNSTNTLSENPPSDVSQTAQKITVPKEAKKKKLERCIRTTSDKTLMLKSLLNIVRHIKNESSNSEEIEMDNSYYMIPVLFSTQNNFMSFLTDEKHALTCKSKHNLATEMDMYCDKLEENLETAATEKRLNDFLVSLSPCLSMKTWKHMCELYAHQLINEGDIHKAVSYLLCIHKTYKAIEVFQDANLYEEAYILAKCKLQPDDPILTDVLRNWAKYSTYLGNFEQTAYIHAKLGEFPDVVKYLVRRKDAATLLTAYDIALLCNDTSSKSIAEQAIAAALTNSEYDLVRTIIAKIPYLKYQEVHLLTFEELQRTIQKDVTLDTIQTWLDGKSEYNLLRTLETVCGDCNSYYNDLCENNFLNTLENEKMLWITVGHEISLAVASVDKEQKLKHIVTAFHTITQFETIHRKDLEYEHSFLMEIVVKLDSTSLTDETSIYRKTDYPVSTSLRAYLCYAFLCLLVHSIDKEPVNDNVEIYIDLIEQLLEDALNKQTVRHWSIGNDISKLENRIASTICKTQEEGKNDQDVESLIEELSTLKIERKEISNKLVHVPNPVMVYCKANELSNKLPNETIKNKFSEVISKLWTNATT